MEGRGLREWKGERDKGEKGREEREKRHRNRKRETSVSITAI